jgi:type III pantothenate kinase
MLLAIDIGNTKTALCLYDGADEIEYASIPTGDLSRERLEPFFARCTRCAAASVVPDALQFIQAAFNKPIKLLDAKADLPISIRYHPKESIGADRIANCIALNALYSRPAVAVDFGTATTLSVLDAYGSLIGGCIMPGAMTAYRALLAGASNLKEINLEIPRELIGDSTEKNLQIGCFTAHAIGVDALIAKIKAEIGDHPTVVATGGLCELFAPHCPQIEVVNHRLTLEGIRLFAEG